ncbi:MAG: LamG-like jellyroll fold domain-containing protein, partial [Massilia sp.]
MNNRPTTRFSLPILALLLACALVLGLLPSPAKAVIVFRGSASGINTGLPTNGTAGALTITRPAVAKPGMVMVVSIAARPSGMTWTSPTGTTWTQLSINSEQPSGGVSTAPGGMSLRTYYRIVGLSEPTSYTWTFANPTNAGGTAVGGMLVFSGIDTSSNPINGTPTSVLSPSGTTFTTTPVTTTLPNTMMISVLSMLSADSFGVPSFVASTACTNSGASAITDVLDVRSPTAASATGTTVDMAYFTQANAGTSCATKATITTAGSADNGIAHLMALRTSLSDLSLDKTRNVPLSPGGTASYTLTANNEGSLPEPGPLAIVDTLPAGLTYTGFSGAGWFCSVSGQVVTCTKSGAVAAGTSATPLVINVSVAAGLNGVITNSAIVSGTGGDGNSANDTASETYVILPQPYAYYAMDEAANAVSFANTTALTAAPATALGTAKAAGNPPPTVGAALTGSPGTCGAVNTPSTAGAGINTGIDVNSVGNSGSIAFWYAGSAAWNDGNARMLFDASNDLGANAADRHFFLAKDSSGRLVFSLKDSAGTISTASSISYSFGANTWHHIAVTWDLATDYLAIYLDGDSTPIATSVTNVNGVLGDTATLYIGAQRNAGVTTGASGAPAGYTANPANGYLDEVRIYNRALAPLEVEAMADLNHACAGTVDHYELVVPATASACVPLPVVQVYACAATATASACSGNLQTAVNGKTVSLSANAGTLAATTPTFDAIGQTNTTLDYPTGGSSTVTLTIGGAGSTAPSALNAARCCPSGSSCVNATSCTTVITACSIPAAKFDVVDSDYAANSYDGAATHRIFTKLAGWNEVSGAFDATGSRFKLDIAALKSGGTTETSY